ncbi:MAG: hypothetical protein LDL53_03795 [Candidatus Hydrogenedens sp.]|nr:hypothetical protein [Candidatus Hydrogenedens sp.]
MLKLFQKPIRVIAIDFGSNAIRVLIGEQNKEGSIVILGYGTSPTESAISKGIIQDIDATRQALHHAISMAYQKNNKVPPKLISIGINTPRAETQTKEGVVRLKNEEITEEHMYQAFDMAQRELNKHEKELITSVTSYEWYIDNIGVSQPLGMKANQLKIRLHATLIPKVIIENIRNCIESVLTPTHSVIDHFIYSPIATALGSLTPEEFELGALIIDLGKTTTNMAVFSEHKLLYASTFDFGTIFLTRDVTALLKVTFDEANKLIYDYGISSELINNPNIASPAVSELKNISGSTLSLSSERKNNPVHLQSALDGFSRNIPKMELEGVIFARAQEMVHTLKQEIDIKKLENTFIGGVVLAGGGAQLKNFDILVKKCFNTPVRIARPLGIQNIPQSINNSEFATVVGILKHGFTQYNAIQKGTVFQHKRIANQFFHFLTSPKKLFTSKKKRTNAS